jgi:dihydrolipoamide dehydrogenase
MPQVQDVVVVGGGAGGFSAAVRAAQLGGKVTVVESAQTGGTCMNHGCIPLTFLMAAAHLLHSIHTAGRFGIRVESARVDIEALHRRKELIVETLRMGTEQLLADNGVTLLGGRGRLSGAGTVLVGDERVQARNVILATGSVEAPLPIPGADLPGVIGTREAMQLTTPPARLVVLGNQPWDVELAQYFCALGSQVTLIADTDPWLAGADRGLAQRLGQALRDGGITIRRGARVQAIRHDPGGALAVVLADAAGEVVADQVLAARRASRPSRAPCWWTSACKPACPMSMPSATWLRGRWGRTRPVQKALSAPRTPWGGPAAWTTAFCRTDCTPGPRRPGWV